MKIKKKIGEALSLIFKGRVIDNYDKILSDKIKTRLLSLELVIKGINKLNRSTYKKKTDKIFIFGSGESVANLKDEDWEHISKFDTAALNYFYIHDFTPDLLFVELNDYEPLYEYIRDQCLNCERFSETKIIFQYKHARKTDLYKFKYLNEIYSYVPYNLPSMDEGVIEEYLKKRRSVEPGKIIHHASHVSALVDYCIFLGYKEIILIGVDLNGGKYFYELNSASKLYPNNKKYVELDRIRKKFFGSIGQSSLTNHQSMNKSLSESLLNLNIFDYFKIYKNSVRSEIKVYNESSELRKIFKIYKKH
ncbi:TPA: hypothetical protein I7791_05720 [Vibrio vulnificus]|nr:hypothetical protein [Vibrio vulnificus]